MAIGTFSSNVTIDEVGVPKGGITTDVLIDAREAVKPQYLPELYRRFGGYMDGQAIFESMGRVASLPVSDSTLNAFEENRPHAQILVVTGASAGSAGGTVTIVVNNSDGYLRQHDEIPVGSNIILTQIISAVTNSATLSLTLKPKSSTATIPLIPNGTYLSIMSNNYGDGVGVDGSTSVGVSKVSFKAQIIKEKYEQTGRAPIKELWYAVRDKSSGSIIGRTSDGLLRLSHLMRLKTDYTCMWGEENSNSLTDYSDATKASTGTKGMFRINKTRGAQLIGIGTTFDPDNLNIIQKYMIQQGATSGVFLWMLGIDLYNSIQKGLESYFASAGGSGQAYINAAKVFNSTGINTDATKEISAVVNYTAIQFGNGTHIFKVMESWGDVTMLGTSFYKFTEKGIVFPISKVTDAKDNSKVFDNIAIRYLAKDEYNRMNHVWQPDPLEIDKTTYCSLADKMFTWMCANQSVYLEM